MILLRQRTECLENHSRELSIYHAPLKVKDLLTVSEGYISGTSRPNLPNIFHVCNKDHNN